MTMHSVLRTDLGKGLKVALPGLALLVLLWPSYRDVSTGLWQQTQNGYLPWLTALSLWLIWYRGRNVTLAPEERWPLSGIVLLTMGVIGYVLGRSQRIELIELASLIPMLAGLLRIAGGKAALRQMRFPLLFLFFALPFPGSVIDSLTTPLKEWIAFGSSSLLHHLGYPIARNGVVLVLWPYRLLVADACSSLHSLIFLTALGLLYLHLTEQRSRLHWTLVALALLPIAVLANFIRVLALLLITYHLGDASGQGY